MPLKPAASADGRGVTGIWRAVGGRQRAAAAADSAAEIGERPARQAVRQADWLGMTRLPSYASQHARYSRRIAVSSEEMRRAVRETASESDSRD